MLVGIDEVGRGCLAGPLVIGAVSLSIPLRGLRDSKHIKPDKRQILAQEIYALSDFAALGWCWPHEVDELGLTKATTLAIERALIDLDKDNLEVIIDGNYNYLPRFKNVKTLIKADDLIPSVSAASIIAKVARDNYMLKAAKYFPAYGFDEHVGYGTKYHMQQILAFGPCSLHRLSFKIL